MKDILKLDILNYNKELLKLSSDEIKRIILDNNFLNVDDSIFICTFNRIDSELKTIFIEDSNLLIRLLSIASKQKTRFNIFDLNTQELIIKKIPSFLEIEEQEYFNLLKSMNSKIYLKFINYLNDYIYNNEINTNNKLFNDVKNIYKNKDKEKIENYISKKFNINDEKILNHISLNFLNKKINIFELYRIETYEQLYIYNKFNILVNKDLFNEISQEKYNISIELLNRLNSKHIIRIINELKNKEGYIDSKTLFITSIKLYCLFGLDNSIKIINDKFTYSTETSIIKAAELKFTSDRRSYRLSHPDDFLNYELIEKLRKSIQNNELNIVKKITSNSDTIYIKNLFNELKENYTLYKNDSRLIKYFNETIRGEIILRELNLKNEFVADYYQNNSNKRKPVTCIELFKLFGEFDPFYTKFDDNNNVIMDKNLKQFLLHNEKNDKTNSALLRMVLNNQALDYNNELVNIINNYYKIEKLKEESNIKSKNSLLDTLDIYKSLKYKLDYDELDIPLSIISKITLSKKFLTVDNEEEVINSFKEIYKKAKKKFSSTIPKVKGETNHKYKYKILYRNNIELLTCGIDADCCFKPGGLGGKFYEYALTSKYSDVIGIWDPENNFYICPIIRNGNGIYGNGIDPSNISNDKLPYVIDALKKCYSDIIKRSYPEEKIEFCTLSNLHNYINSDNNYKEIDIDKSPIIGEPFYCDIIKNDIKNYVIVGDASNIKEYIPEKVYESTRNKKYVYSKDQKENRLLIEHKINEIEYRSIDLKNCSDLEKKQLKENYKPINIDEYKYIVCNEDWYLALSENLEIKSTILPYDSRAKYEYLAELQKVKSNYQIITELEKEKTK